MRLRDGFEERLAVVETGQDGPVEPSQMCVVAAEVLGVAGAGLVMSHRHLRLPVGASSPAARVAEEIQASLGVGPCLTAEATQTVLVADEPDLARRWPMYHFEIVRRTPFRATLSFPIVYAGASFAALDVYSEHPTWTLEEELDVVQSEVVDLIGIRLLMRQLSQHETDNEDVDGTSYAPNFREPAQLRRRGQVWVAVGMVRGAEPMSEADALALLRGHAFRTDRLLDDVAADLAERRLSTAEVLNPALQ